jgi:hypothetical protein
MIYLKPTSHGVIALPFRPRRTLRSFLSALVFFLWTKTTCPMIAKLKQLNLSICCALRVIRTLSLYARIRRTVHFEQVGPLKDDASICWFESEELDRMPVFVGKWLKEDGQIRNSVQALTISLQRLGQPLQRHFICQNISSHACFLLDKPVLDRRSVQLHVTSMPLARTC